MPHRDTRRTDALLQTLKGWLAPCVVVLASMPGSVVAREEPPDAPQAGAAEAPAALDEAAVQQLFLQHCAACHGAEGHGDGPAAELLYPKPRSFLDSPFRFAPGQNGDTTALRSIERTIRDGMPRSAMPGFGGALTEQEIKGLTLYVSNLSKDVSKQFEKPAIVDKPNAPPLATGWLEAQGAWLYRTKLCINCHGESGRGDGAEMKRLLDSLGRPIQPANLASGIFKSGSQPEDIYRTIVNGVPGTPMASYGPLLITKYPDGSMDDSAVWSLVAYIRSLAPGHIATGRSSGLEVRAISLPDAAAIHDPSHSTWLNIASKAIALRRLWQRQEPAHNINASLVRTGDTLALRLWWDDATCDVDQDLGRFSDGVAVMFSMSDEVPSLPMGVEVAGHTPSTPVNVWQWKGSRQYDASSGKPHDSDDPRVLPEGNYFLFGPAAKPVADDPNVSPIGAKYGQDIDIYAPFNQAAAATGNPHDSPALLSRAVLEANALGFGTLTYQDADRQNAESTAVWANGHWFVTISRTIKADGDQDIDFTTPRRIPIAFAVWDGAMGDRDGLKLISGWHWLVIEPESSTQTSSGTR